MVQPGSRLKIRSNVKKLTTLLPMTLLAFMALSIAPTSHAYGKAQWQAGFSGTCNNPSFCGFFGFPPGFTGGFWGWCEFGGSNGASSPGTTGTSGDCQISVYVNPPGQTATNPYHISQDVTSWLIDTGSLVCPSTSMPCFFITGGSLELTGPGSPGPTGVQIPLAAVCNLSNIPASLAGNPACDTGIPAIPGHFSFHPGPGLEFNLQVTHIP